MPLDVRHAANFLDLGARHRLVIGDDGERLDRGARQFARDDRFMRQQPGEIVGGAQRPFAADAHEIDAARRVFLLQLRQQRAHVDAGGQTRCQGLLVERRLGGKQQRFEDAQFLRALLPLFVVFVADNHSHLRDVRHWSVSPLTHSPIRLPILRQPCARLDLRHCGLCRLRK